jgi:hypothetical protein
VEPVRENRMMAYSFLAIIIAIMAIGDAVNFTRLQLGVLQVFSIMLGQTACFALGMYSSNAAVRIASHYHFKGAGIILSFCVFVGIGAICWFCYGWFVGADELTRRHATGIGQGMTPWMEGTLFSYFLTQARRKVVIEELARRRAAIAAIQDQGQSPPKLSDLVG